MIQIRMASVEEVYHCACNIPEFKGIYPLSEFRRRLENKGLCLIAEENKETVGFKCGYPSEKTSTSFYSWMGGVVTSRRCLGIAKMLLNEMESWCKEKGFTHLIFKTLNEHKGMIIFALKNGFDIVDIANSSKDVRKRIWLSKILKDEYI